MGKEWSKNWLFILFECCVNLFVILDIVFKLKLLGCRNYFADCNNTIDFILGVIILTVFIAFQFLQTFKRPYRYFDELLEEILYVIWFIW